ncbi:ion channel [Marinobacter sp. M1N3S26]|uniref:ion channel n=1 Tax=unclassified Marinobacter TaxID=83889 RepID=UPI00387B194E
MLINLIIGLSTMTACLLLQAILLVLAIRYYIGHIGLATTSSSWSMLRVICAFMVMLVLGNLLQCTIWALVFMVLGEFEALSEAVYHSAVNFATLGYGDIVMSERHRLLGPIEAINGVIMIGVSTAALMTALQHSLKESLAAQRWTLEQRRDDHESH